MDVAASLVAQYAGYTGAAPTSSSGSGVQLQAQDGSTISGLATVCTYLAVNGSSPSAAALYSGLSPELQAQIDEWLTWASTELTPPTDEKMFKLNAHLEPRTFIVGTSLTLADLVVFGVVQPAAVAFPAAQTLHFASILRWADYIQHLAGPARLVFTKKLELVKPRFQAPALLPPPAPKAPAAAPAANGAAPAGTAAAKADGAKPAGGKQAAPAPASNASAAAAAPAPSGATAASAAGAAAAAATAPAAGGEGKKGKKEKAEGDTKEGSKKGDGGGKKKEGDDEPHIGLLDIRVGTIVKVGRHPNAEKLYLEEIDLGEDKPRQVISGLVEFVPMERMQGLRVLVVCNLKPQKMREVMSYGMVLCASNDAHTQVDPIVPPEGVPNGERITFEGFPGPPLEEVNPKKKILEKLLPDMKTDASCVPNFKGAVFMTSKGPLTATIPNAHVA